MTLIRHYDVRGGSTYVASPRWGFCTMPEWVYRVCLPRLRFKKDGEMDKRSSGYRDLCKAGEWLAMAHVKQAELQAPYWDDENDCYIDAEPGSLG